MSRTFISISLISLAMSNLSGCASVFGPSSASWPWPETTKICANATCTAAESRQAFLNATNFCRDVQNYYEAGGQKSNSTKVAVGAVGAVAGSVIAPIAHGAAATAWSGLSGATNALQMSVEEAFSSAVSIKRRAAVETAATDGATAFTVKSISEDEKVIAAINMARSCSMSSAKADQQTVKSLSQ